MYDIYIANCKPFHGTVGPIERELRDAERGALRDVAALCCLKRHLVLTQRCYNLLENKLQYMENHCEPFLYKSHILCSLWFIYIYWDDKNSKLQEKLIYVDRRYVKHLHSLRFLAGEQTTMKFIKSRLWVTTQVKKILQKLWCKLIEIY